MKKEINKNKIAFYSMGMSVAGGERVLLDLANGFSRKNYEVDLLLFRKKGLLLEKIDSNINIIDLNSSRIIFSVFPIIKYLKKEKPSFVMATSEHANIVLLLAKIASRTKTKVFVRVGIDPEYFLKGYKNIRDSFIPHLIKFLYPKADKVIANSTNIAIGLNKILKIPREKIKLIYNPKFIDEILEESKVGEWKFENKFTILSVGRLRKQKDFETLIKAFSLVKKEINSQLIILGGGEEENRLKELTSELGLEKDVHFEGVATNPYFYMKNSDLFVSSSLWEGFSNALIEAGICGMPIIATDCGSGSRELLAPNTDLNKKISRGNIEYADFGILVPKGDVKKMEEAILEMMKKDALREKYSKKIKERVEIFDINSILRQFNDIL